MKPFSALAFVTILIVSGWLAPSARSAPQPTPTSPTVPLSVRPLPAAAAPAPATVAPAPVAVSPAPRAEPLARSDDPPAPADELKFNFRGVPLDTVLDYLSRAAGFIIVREAKVEGAVDVVSHRPLNKDEAVALLNTILLQKGFAAIRTGPGRRTLTIVTRQNAVRRNIPIYVLRGLPDDIPEIDEIVTMILPVKYADVAQLIENMRPLLPEDASLTANQGSNALVLTATQTDIRRMAELIQALDTSISEISKLKVYGLKYADAEEVARVITEVFQARSRTTRTGDDRMQRLFSGRGGPFGGDRGGDNNNNQPQASGASQARQAQALVVAVADTRTNSLVVSAPQEVVPIIDELVKDIDTMSEDITEVRVFTLRYADATETAESINDVFDTTRQSRSSSRDQRGRMFGGPFSFMRGGPGGGPGGRGGSQDNTEREIQEETVTAVADTRTNSIIVRAASTIMTQIDQMVQSLDANPARQRNVYTYSLENANPEEVAAILEGLFGSQQGSSTSNRARTTSTNRGTGTGTSQRNSNSSRRGSSGTGSSSGGRSSGGGSSFGGGSGSGSDSGFGSLR